MIEILNIHDSIPAYQKDIEWISGLNTHDKKVLKQMEN